MGATMTRSASISNPTKRLLDSNHRILSGFGRLGHLKPLKRGTPAIGATGSCYGFGSSAARYHAATLLLKLLRPECCMITCCAEGPIVLELLAAISKRIRCPAFAVSLL